MNEERTSNMVENGIMGLVNILGDLATTQNILAASNRYPVTPEEVIPSNPVENIPLNGNAIQIR